MRALPAPPRLLPSQKKEPAVKKILSALMEVFERRAAERVLSELDERTLRDIGLDAGSERERMRALRNRLTFGLY